MFDLHKLSYLAIRYFFLTRTLSAENLHQNSGMVKPGKKHHIKVAGMHYSAIRYAVLFLLFWGVDMRVDSLNIEAV